MRNRTEEAFTLKELMIVVLIIGILAAITVPIFQNQRQAATDSSVQVAARNFDMQVGFAVSDARREGKKRLVTFADVKTLMESEDVHLGLAQDFDAGGNRRYCVLAYSDNSETYTHATPFVLYDGDENKPCPVDTSGAIWR